MADGVISGLKSAAGAAYSAGKKVAGATQRAVSPELTRTASSCQLIEALEDNFGEDIAAMIKAGKHDQAKQFVDSTKKIDEVAKALGCRVK